MQFDAYLGDVEVQKTSELSTQAEEMGFDGAWVSEATGSPYTRMALSADATDRMDIGSAIALAFPRSPMVTAYTSWDLQRLSGGRFTLGLGTQVKGHIQRRFDTDFEPPGPRLRDYIECLRTIWDAWEKSESLEYSGEFYEIDLCPPDFRPEPIENPRIPIYIGGVNEYNLRLAGEICDGLHIHPMNSPKYINEVVIPNIRAGAEKTGRTLDDMTLASSVFAILGDAEERKKHREEIRYQIAFYGSTRTYQTLFEVHGWDYS